MKNNISPYRHTAERPEGINVSQLFSKILANWYWFLLFTLLGIGVGMVYYKHVLPNYQVSSTILVKTDSKQAALSSLFQDLGVNNKSTNILNQVGILKSYTLNLKTLQNLQWDVSWYEQSLFSQLDLYQQEPFNVTMPEGSLQIKMLPVYIIPVSEEEYMLKSEGEFIVDGVKQEVEIMEQAAFGQPFVNEYFNFTIDKIKGKPVEIGGEYILIFNDLSQLALNYSKRLNIKMADEESDLIHVEFESSQPARAVNYLNELGEVYIQFGLNEKNRVADMTVRFIDGQIAGVTDSLQLAGQDFTNFRSTNKIVDLGQEGGLVVDKLEEIERQESIGNMKVEYYNNLQQYLKNSDQMEDLVAPSVVGVTDPALNALVLKLSELYGQREVLSYTVQEKNPTLISLDKEINYTQNILEENIDNLLGNSRLELRNLHERKQKVNRQLAKLPKTEQDLINFRRSFDLNNELYTFLLQRRAEAGIARASNNPDAKILDPARMDTAIILSPGKMQILLMGLFLGMGIPLLLFTIIDYFDHRLSDVKDVESQLDLPVAGSIIHNKFKKCDLPVFEYSQSAITESFRGLRTNLQYLLKGENKKVLAIHSTIVGEGKSFVSLNLAAIMAINNKRVLLVEADLRKPSLHHVLMCKNDMGLSDYLSGEKHFDDVVLSTKVRGLSFVSAGLKPLYPSEMLNNGPLEKFIMEAKDRFDYIVIDNAPVNIVSDAMIISPYADVNLFVLRMKRSTRDELDFINKTAHEGVIKHMVVALNDASYENQKGYGYYNEDRIKKVNGKKVKKNSLNVG